MATTRIHPETKIGAVHYIVSELGRVASFYSDVLGFDVIRQDVDAAVLGAGERELLRLTERTDAKPAPRAAGLYHTAFLVPTRWDLAHLLRRIIETRTPIQGTSNHGTHLAIYLPDPEGNGIELAWDFPPDVWPMKDGQFDLAAAPREGVDLGQLMEEIERDPSPWNGLSPDTVVGHIHLHASDLGDAEQFYHGVLGFDVTLRSASFGASFFSAGGYHHHIGTNIWRGRGAPQKPEGARGLESYRIVTPSDKETARIKERLVSAGIDFREIDGRVRALDPAGIPVEIGSA